MLRTGQNLFAVCVFVSMSWRVLPPNWTVFVDTVVPRLTSDHANEFFG